MTNVTRRDFLGAALLAPAAMRAAAAGRPNFLYLLPDQFRFDWLSGNPSLPIRTPNLDALARRGVRFTKAAVAAPVCAPSRACLAAGCEYDECGVASNAENYSLSRPTYYRKLRDSGYHTAACGKVDLSKAANEQGIDGRKHMEWGFSDMINCGGKGDAVSKNGAGDPHEPYMLYLKKLGLAQTHADDIAKRFRYGYSATFPTPITDEDYCDNWVGRTGLELMKRVPQGKPWHLVVNFVGPHDPEDITVRMERTVRGRSFRQPNGSTEFTPDVHNAIRQNYTAMVENLDRWVGIYVEELKRRGELDNTIIVFSSDHGEMLGDHDRWAKTVPYEASLCVPLIAAGPGIKPRQRSNALVSIIDIGATFLNYADAGKLEGQTARSFRPLLEGKTGSHREFVSSGLFAWRLVSDGRYKLIRGYDPEAGIIGTHDVRVVQPRPDVPPLLFDLESDPLENNNIASKAPDVAARLSKLLPPPNPDPRFNHDPRLGGERSGGGRRG
jgi:arylsulfatase A-like enzyme